MKIIPKFALGQSMFVTYSPAEAETVSSTKTSKTSKKSSTKDKDEDDDDEKGKLTERDLANMIKGTLDAIPVDADELMADFVKTLRIAKLSGEEDLGGLESVYYSALLKLKKAAWNKDLYQNAFERAKEAKGLSEIAITPTGEVVVMTLDHDITTISPKDLQKSKATPLTNSNLLWLRAHDPRYAGDSNYIFSIVENAISMDLVNTMIKDRFLALGTDTTSQEAQTIKDVNGKVKAGVKILTDLAERDGNLIPGVYNTKYVTESLQKLAEAALAYIYSSLPTNAKALLVAKTGSEKGALQLVWYSIARTASSKADYSSNYASDVNKVLNEEARENRKELREAEKARQEELDKIQLTAPVKLLRGMGVESNIKINLGSTNTIFSRAVSGTLTDSSGNNLGPLKTLSQVFAGEFGNILDVSNVSMGMGRISPSLLSHVVASDGRITLMDFPCITLRDGTIVPNLDLALLAKKSSVERSLASRGIIVSKPEHRKKYYREINASYKANGLDPLYNELGELTNNSWRRFGVINGYADKRALSGAKENLIKSVNNDDDYTNVTEAIKESDKKYSASRKSLYFFEGDPIYLGTIWIPIMKDYVGSLKLNNLQATLVTAASQASERNLNLGIQPRK